MRERTTWNREQIAKLAAGGKVADDPRAMNQDHLKQQPAADKYVIGDPSDFAEDVATPNWKAEYSGGEVKRNEIGMPEMRGETFNHAEKTAGDQGQDDDEDFLQKKADVCINLARRMLGKNASEQALEDQALAFMHLPDSAIVATATRIADQEEGQEQSQEQKQAQQQDDKGQEQKQAQQQTQESEEQKQAAKKAQQQDDKSQQSQDKEAGQIPENFKKKDDEGEDEKKQAGQVPENFKKDEGDDEQKKQAKRAADMAMYSQQACDALMKGDTQAAQQAVQQMVQMSQGQQQPMLSQEQAQQQVQQMFSQAMGQPQQPTMADDQLLDQMLQQPQQQMMASAPTSASAATMDIELQGASMDTGEVRLGSEDEALATLFASHTEVRDAAQAHEILTGVPHQASVAPAGGMTRTASTRTVGTRPTGGVAQLGGGTSGEAPSNDIDKLSGLWASAPDVRSVFGS